MTARHGATRSRAVWAVGLVLGVLAAFPTAAVAAPGGEATVQTTATQVVAGEPFEVMLAGWPAGAVSVSLCGQRAVGGSADCATELSTLVVVGADGTGSGTLVGVVPPVGCPCVLRATTLTGQVTATLPVVLPAATATDEVAARSRTVVPTSRLVVAASAEPVGGWGRRVLAAVGGPAAYRVAVTVQNTGGVTSRARTVDVLAGRDTLGGAVVGSLDVAPIEPGALLTRELDVRLGAPLVGSYVLHGELDPADVGSVFVAQVESWPVVAGAVLLYLPTWWLLRRRARRHPGRVAVPALRALAVAAVVAAVVVAGHWGVTRWLEDSRARQAQSALLAGFAPRLGQGPDGRGTGGQIVRPAAATNLPVTGDLVGVLRFPALDDLQLAVVEGVTPEQLGRGPGHYPGTAQPGELGNVVVAGHNARSGAGAPFVDLHRLVVGDAIRFETAAGAWTYSVTGVRVVAPTAVSLLLPVRDVPSGEPTTSQLTLVTCDYSQGGRTNRFVVDAEVVAPVVSG